MILDTSTGIQETGVNKEIPFDAAYFFYFQGAFGPSPVVYPYLHANEYDENGNIITITNLTESYPVDANKQFTLAHTPIVGDAAHPITITHNNAPIAPANYTINGTLVTINTYNGTTAPTTGDTIVTTYSYVDNTNQPVGTDITNYVSPEINE